MNKYLRNIKRIIKALIGRDFFIKEQVKLDKVAHGGSDGYGAWDICENDIDSSSIVYSVGVGEDVSFDVSIIARFGLNVFAFDPTPKSISWVHSQDLPKKFQLFEYGLADFDGTVRFNPPKNHKHVSHTILDRKETEGDSIEVEVKKLSTIMRELGHNNIDILKMDIEGAEYAVIDDIINSEIRPQQLLIEFHHRFPSVGIEKTIMAIQSLNDIGYSIFSVSDSGEEYSFMYMKK